MHQRVRSLCVLVVLAALAAAIPATAAPATTADVYGKLPLTFEANAGQIDNAAVRYVSRGHGHTLFLSPAEAALRLRGEEGNAVVRWHAVGGNRNARVTGESPLATRSNYFRGSDRGQWRTDVANFAKVRYERVYPGIDVVYHGTQGQLEYDFVVAPKADPKRIRVAFEGAASMTIDANGDLLLDTAAGTLVQPRPVVYQEIGGQRRLVEGRYAKLGAREIGFVLGAYDRNRELVIDPVILYATYAGGSLYDAGHAIAVDGSGNAYITGLAESLNYPTVNAIQSSNAYDYEAYVTKINAAGTAIVYSTYLGGNGGNEYGMAIAVDSSANVYVAGGTNSTNFPGISGSSFQSTYGGYWRDGFVTKINAAGNAITYSTYLGGSGDDLAWGVAADSSGNAYVTGSTGSSNFPLSSAMQGSKNGTGDAFLVKLGSTGTVVYSTYVGGSSGDDGTDIAADSSGNAYLIGVTGSTDFPGVTGSVFQPAKSTGSDGFVMKVNSTGSTIVYASYYGDTGSDSLYALEVDGSGNAYLAGRTDSTALPGVTGSSIQSSNAGGNDCFVAKINSTATAITWATFLGGPGYDMVGSAGLGIDSSNNVYISGATNSSSFAGVNGTSMQPSLNGSSDAFLTKINAAGTSIVWSTYIGGSGTESGYGCAVDTNGNVYHTGRTDSTDYPGMAAGAIDSTHNGGDGDAYIVKVGNPGNPVITSVSPTSGRAGALVVVEVVAGDGDRVAGGLAWLGSKNAATITSWSNNVVVATIASGAVTGSAYIKQNGVWSSAVAFTVLTPVITGVTPTTARAGDQITITGNYFGTSGTAAQVWLGNKAAATIVSWSDTQVVATVASGASSGTVQIQAGGVWYNYGSFTVVTPNISGISPTSGPVGTNVTITGTGFGATRGSGNVWLGGKLATNIVSWSDTQVVATVPSGATTSGTQVYQNGVWSNGITFTVTP
jgi:hypothetical protein